MIQVFLCKGDNSVKDYNYLLFENFVLNEKIFQMEVAVIRQLQNYCSHLEGVWKGLNKRLSNKLELAQDGSAETSLKGVKNEAMASNLKDLIHSEFLEYQKSESLSDSLVKMAGDNTGFVLGALWALAMLQETYNLDILEMAEGRVMYKGKVFQVRHVFQNPIFTIVIYGSRAVISAITVHMTEICKFWASFVIFFLIQKFLTGLN